jgi:hypothetical protein
MEMAFPKIGNMAPAFSLPNQDGNKVSPEGLSRRQERGAVLLSQGDDAGLHGTGLWPARFECRR